MHKKKKKNSSTLSKVEKTTISKRITPILKTAPSIQKSIHLRVCREKKKSHKQTISNFEKQLFCIKSVFSIYHYNQQRDLIKVPSYINFSNEWFSQPSKTPIYYSHLIPSRCRKTSSPIFFKNCYNSNTQSGLFPPPPRLSLSHTLSLFIG